MTTPKDTALSACEQLMEPIVAMLLRNGVNHKDLALICKQLFVKVASEEFGIRGRDTNLSRVAMLTGIDRKEVARIKESLNSNNPGKHSQQQQDRLTRLLSAWHQDPEFCNAAQQPLALPVEGDSGSFAQLARRYGGDMPASALLKELKLAQVVTSQEDGRIIATQRYFIPAQSDPAALLRAGSVLQDLGGSLYHNLYKANSDTLPARASREQRAQQALRFERRASNPHMPASQLAAFQAFVEQEGLAFLERADAWLSAHEQHEQTNAPDSAPEWRLGVGTYLFCNPVSQEGDAQSPAAESAQDSENGEQP